MKVKKDALLKRIAPDLDYKFKKDLMIYITGKAKEHLLNADCLILNIKYLGKYIVKRLKLIRRKKEIIMYANDFYNKGQDHIETIKWIDKMLLEYDRYFELRTNHRKNKFKESYIENYKSPYHGYKNNVKIPFQKKEY